MTTSNSDEKNEIADEFLARLEEDLVCRHVEHGMSLLERHRDIFRHFDPNSHNAGILAGYLAQWVDIGFQLPGLVKAIVVQFTKGLRARLPLRDYLHLRMAEGMEAMSEELTIEAIHHFDFVLSLAEETDDKTLLAIASFWKGRCLRMKG